MTARGDNASVTAALHQASRLLRQWALTENALDDDGTQAMLYGEASAAINATGSPELLVIALVAQTVEIIHLLADDAGVPFPVTLKMVTDSMALKAMETEFPAQP